MNRFDADTDPNVQLIEVTYTLVHDAIGELCLIGQLNIERPSCEEILETHQILEKLLDTTNLTFDNEDLSLPVVKIYKNRIVRYSQVLLNCRCKNGTWVFEDISRINLESISKKGDQSPISSLDVQNIFRIIKDYLMDEPTRIYVGNQLMTRNSVRSEIAYSKEIAERIEFSQLLVLLLATKKDHFDNYLFSKDDIGAILNYLAINNFEQLPVVLSTEERLQMIHPNFINTQFQKLRKICGEIKRIKLNDGIEG